VEPRVYALLCSFSVLESVVLTALLETGERPVLRAQLVRYLGFCVLELNVFNPARTARSAMVRRDIVARFSPCLAFALYTAIPHGSR